MTDKFQFSDQDLENLFNFYGSLLDACKITRLLFSVSFDSRSFEYDLI